MNDGNQKKILLVEDDPILSLLEKKILEQESFEVFVASNGEQAISIVREFCDIDLVIMDIDLGAGMDGTEAAKIILNMRDLPLIFLSSHTEKEIIEKTEGITSYGYIVKSSGSFVLITSIQMAFRLFEAKQNAKKKDSKIRENEEYLDTLLHTTRDGFWVVDLEGKISDVNSAYCQLSGYSREEILSMKIEEIDAIEKPIDIQNRIQRILKNGSELFETKHRKKDGTEFYVEVSVNYLNLYGGRFICFCRDITKRKEMERDLLEQKNRLHEAQHLAKIGSWDLNILNNKLNWSDEIYNIFEKEKNSSVFTYENFLEFVHPEDREFVESSYSHSLEKHLPYDIKHRLLFPDGSVKYVHERAQNYYDSEGNPLRSLGTVQDITQEVMIKDELNQNNQTLMLILDTIPQSIFWKDTKGEYLGCNRAFANLVGLDDPSQIRGLYDSDLHWSKDDILKFQSDDKFIIENSCSKLHTIDQVIKKNGEIVIMDISKFPLLNPNGKVLGILGFYQELDKTK